MSKSDKDREESMLENIRGLKALKRKGEPENGQEI